MSSPSVTVKAAPGEENAALAGHLSCRHVAEQDAASIQRGVRLLLWFMGITSRCRQALTLSGSSSLTPSTNDRGAAALQLSNELK
ncbi:hypothetical protein JOB18_039427 [Solea senegalensis]|uniref:Uncharacterized protein n=1 Tax=Solea senegalensis TaxID=28829 RepID=A0AAV6PIP5_SOLSE|nr:hypothetical protein JOB18_039427 [Solea senegalensis]